MRFEVKIFSSRTTHLTRCLVTSTLRELAAMPPPPAAAPPAYGNPGPAAANLVLQGKIAAHIIRRWIHRVFFFFREISPPTTAKTPPRFALPKIECRDNKTYYFAVARGATRAADAVLLQGVRRFEDEIAWLFEEDNFAHAVRGEL